jgi:anti-sigma B factor antagonist
MIAEPQAVTSISTELLPDGTLVLKPTGPISLSAQSDTGLLAAFNDAVEKGQLRILLDFSETNLMDSAGVAALVRGWIQVRRAGGDVVLARPVPSIRNMLTITRLISLFKTSETLDEGLGKLRSGTAGAERGGE